MREPSRNDVDTLSAALAVFVDYRRRAARGQVEPPAALLAAHTALRPALDTLLRSSLQPGPDIRVTLADYELGEEIGRGGTGVVYRAHGRRLSREVACKVIHGHLLHDARSREQFWREASAAATLQHVGICPVYDYGEHERVPYLVMRLLRGGSVRARFEATRADRASETGSPWQDTVALIATIARAVHHAHERGVVHGDLKPGNVMFDENGHPVIVDFGLAVRAADGPVGQLSNQQAARALAAAAPSGATRADPDRSARVASTQRRQGVAVAAAQGHDGGTLAYMAPERIAGERPSVVGDVFALGVMLYEGLAGRRPFDGAYAAEVRSAILHVTPEPVRCGPRDLRVVLAACLAKEPLRRLGSAGDLADELHRVLRHEPVRIQTPGWMSRGWRWARRNPVAAALLAIATGTCVWMVLLLAELGVAARANSIPALRHRVREAVAQADQLFPAWPQHLPAMAAWLTHSAELRSALADAGAGSALATSVRDLDTSTAMVREQQAWASTRADVSRHAASWRTAAAAIAAADGKHASELYARLRIELTPQADLVPIGVNPVTRLWEFAHLPSAEDPTEPPAVHAADGSLPVTARAGLVFVLVPGSASPPQPPFLVARYELTFAQWERLRRCTHTTEQPRKLRPGSMLCSKPLQPTHPVCEVDWYTATEVLARVGLALPTGVEWEYACRAGTSTRWSTGDDPAGLEGYANVVDPTGEKTKPEWRGAIFEDGWVGPSPVGTFLPNPWGLYDMHGNMTEWCRDGQPRTASETAAPRASLRGGSYDENVFGASSDTASNATPTLRDQTIGLRVVRPLLNHDAP